jgi:rfaE bifunctional protein nucleotidyltransferase chain/domain
MSHFKNIQEKIFNLDTLVAQVKVWKDQGCKIVFTNGCFDLLHLGHVDYLARASDFGHKLIVALNTDASVSKIKGPHRPICDEKSRLFVMASLESVSAVVLFDEETPLKLIEILLPDVLVKGADYRVEDIVGYDVVINNGGEVKTIKFVDGYSTSAIENRILKAKN